MTGNASLSQYAPPFPPSCLSCAPAKPLPYTGADLFVVGGLGAMLLMFGVVVAVIVKRWP